MEKSFFCFVCAKYYCFSRWYLTGSQTVVLCVKLIGQRGILNHARPNQWYPRALLAFNKEPVEQLECIPTSPHDTATRVITHRAKSGAGRWNGLFVFWGYISFTGVLKFSLKQTKKKQKNAVFLSLLWLPWIPNMPYRTKTTLAENVSTPGWFHKSRITASSNTTAHGWKKKTKKTPAECWSTERATASTERLSDVYYIIVWTFFCQPEQLKALTDERAREADVVSEQHRTELTKKVIAAWTTKEWFSNVLLTLFLSVKEKRKDVLKCMNRSFTLRASPGYSLH